MGFFLYFSFSKKRRVRILFLFFTIIISAFSFAQEIENSKEVEKSLNDAATSFYNQHYLKALNLSKKALSVSLANNDEYHIALSYNLIGRYTMNTVKQKEH